MHLYKYLPAIHLSPPMQLFEYKKILFGCGKHKMWNTDSDLSEGV